MPDSPTWQKVEKACHLLVELSPVIIAYSGGTDSTFLLKLSLDALGGSNVLAVTGISPSLSPDEHKEAERIAGKLNAPFLAINTYEMENESYRQNPANRCFFCKEELFSKLEELRIQKGYKTVLDGSNADDEQEWRPGLSAARMLNVRSPLLEAGLTKEEIRGLSRKLDLPTWDKPAMPCLSSRVPYGEEITTERLARIHQAEKYLRDSGFRNVRVRDHFPIARIEVPKDELSGITQEPLCNEIVKEFKKLGYTFVTLDLSGFKSGSLNQTHEKSAP